MGFSFLYVFKIVSLIRKQTKQNLMHMSLIIFKSNLQLKKLS